MRGKGGARRFVSTPVRRADLFSLTDLLLWFCVAYNNDACMHILYVQQLVAKPSGFVSSVRFNFCLHGVGTKVLVYRRSVVMVSSRLL